jgi:hypothetical protein
MIIVFLLLLLLLLIIILLIIIILLLLLLLIIIMFLLLLASLWHLAVGCGRPVARKKIRELACCLLTRARVLACGRAPSVFGQRFRFVLFCCFCFSGNAPPAGFSPPSLFRFAMPTGERAGVLGVHEELRPAREDPGR